MRFFPKSQKTHEALVYFMPDIFMPLFNSNLLRVRLGAFSPEVGGRVYRIFGLAESDIRLLEDHARHAMIDYTYGDV